MPDKPIDSPTLASNDGIVKSLKEFSDNLTLDLTDAEIKQAFEIIYRSIRKWQQIFRAKLDPHSLRSFHDLDEAMELTEKFEDEIKTRLAEMDILATVDVMPVFEGQPPVIELIGTLPSHYSAQYGLDHERKEYEVRKATERGEPVLGAKDLDV